MSVREPYKRYVPPDELTALRTQNTELQRQVAEAHAVIAKKDEALVISVNLIEMYSLQISHQRDYARITDALAIQPSANVLELIGYATEASIRNLTSGNDVIIGYKNGLRTEAVYRLKDK